MKLVILAGGLGTRISEETNFIPKPMIKIGPKPIIYNSYNYDFLKIYGKTPSTFTTSLNWY